jgi:methanogenic corrinoid protein MtbC1
MARRSTSVSRPIRATKPRHSDLALLSIGALSRSSGVPVATLRTWANRYGFPSPTIRLSGQRLFSIENVGRLRLIRRALALGHRAAQVVSAAPEKIEHLLALAPEEREPQLAPVMTPDVDAALQESIAQSDSERLTQLLLGEWARLTPVEFLAGRVAPLLTSVGEQWSRGELGVRHEHFLTARLSDLLGELRQPLERDNRGPVVVIATLPGERHTLGLSMAALVMAHGGFRILFLGAECPPFEIDKAVRARQARAVGISVSQSSRGKRTERLLRELRKALPRSVRLLTGGLGAPPLPGTIRLDSLPALARFVQRQSIEE